MWSYTPRQISGYLELAAARRKQDMMESVSLMRLAMHGDKKAMREFKAMTEAD